MSAENNPTPASTSLPPSLPREAFSLLRQSSIASPLAEVAEELLLKGNLKFSRMPKAPTLGQATALTETSIETQQWTITLPPETTGPLSAPVLACILVHELHHLTDREYQARLRESAQRRKEIQALEKKLSPTERPYYSLAEKEKRLTLFDQETLFKTEMRAYRGTYEWLQEMDRAQPGFRERIRALYPKGLPLDRVPSSAEIIDAHQLSALSPDRMQNT